MSDGFPEDLLSVRNFPEFNRATLSMGPILEALLLTLHPPTITCIIRDIRMSAVHAIAKKLGIPVVGLATPSAISKQCVFNLPVLISSRLLPLPPPPPDCTPSFNASSLILSTPRSPAEATARQTLVTSHISGVSPTLRVQDFPTHILAGLDDYFLKIHRDIQNPLLPDCDCILFNTFHALEGEVLDAIDLNSHVFAVGPLVLAGAETGSTLRDEEPGVLSWLDTQTPNSVLFVSFGSLATVSIIQVQELASGLEQSNASFLWVIRADTVVDEEKAEFETWFPKFALKIKNRGLLVTWAPQTAVLSHPAIAAFLTHCGWNSTIESIAYGVPMLAWPRFGDQPTNAHYIVHVWKVGMQLEVREAVVAKEEIERKVRKMVAKEGLDPEVDAIRAKSRKLEGAARKAVAKGGSSHAAMAKFVELLERRRMAPCSYS